MRKTIYILLFFFLTVNMSAQDIELQDPISIEFRQDTMIIEQQVTDMLNKDYSTAGMVKASVFTEQGYDKLLNKYYQMLLNKLKEEDRAILIDSQNNWAQYRDSEKQLIRLISSDRYTGGGTIWGPIASGTAADLTKDRLIEIYRYLVFSIEE
ncbi:lysozyme inhibitor LprI family protein [Dysgonomonas macrotermitis]|uniref:Lysozyme inhibitor LprI-like N-terminal domain-containing protein n=1 Tax=Dysgonomonas macrotermitis TaxID=1346286 RepID=A0A1M5F4W0_9BACT|nr:lysozyme inhibitor LprI family protein [Dysgonomonas macrotermitis]SHF86579.1 Protein of unknown function [Dysgonomonas macrotermitis]